MIIKICDVIYDMILVILPPTPDLNPQHKRAVIVIVGYNPIGQKLNS
jgi:hypothetical protein